MAKNTKFINRRYPIGDVKITFDDDTDVTHTINQIDVGDPTSVGTWFDQNSNRSPVTIEALVQSWKISELPAQVTYPDSGEMGMLTYEETYNEEGDTFQVPFMDLLPA